MNKQGQAILLKGFYINKASFTAHKEKLFVKNLNTTSMKHTLIRSECCFSGGRGSNFGCSKETQKTSVKLNLYSLVRTV